MQNKEIINKLKQLRKEAGYSQHQIAKKLFITPSAYSKLERGKTFLTLPRAFQLADIYKIDIDEILYPKRNGIRVEKKFQCDVVAKLLQSSIESFLIDEYINAINQLEDYPLSFEEYLVDNISNPHEAVRTIKIDLENYSFVDADEKEYLNSLYGSELLKSFKNMSEEDVLAYVQNKKNYEKIWEIIMCPSNNKPEDCQEAFEDIVSNRSIRHFFEMNLISDRMLLYHWEVYIKKNNSNDSNFSPIIEKEEITKYLSSIENLNVYRRTNL